MLRLNLRQRQRQKGQNTHGHCGPCTQFSHSAHHISFNLGSLNYHWWAQRPAWCCISAHLEQERENGPEFGRSRSWAHRRAGCPAYHTPAKTGKAPGKHSRRLDRQFLCPELPLSAFERYCGMVLYLVLPSTLHDESGFLITSLSSDDHIACFVDSGAGK